MPDPGTRPKWNFKTESSLTGPLYNTKGNGEGSFSILDDDSISGSTSEDWTGSIGDTFSLSQKTSYTIKGSYNKANNQVTLIFDYGTTTEQIKGSYGGIQINIGGSSDDTTDKGTGRFTVDAHDANHQAHFDEFASRIGGNVSSFFNAYMAGKTISGSESHFVKPEKTVSFTLPLGIGNSVEVRQHWETSGLDYDAILTLQCSCDEMKTVEKVKKQLEQVFGFFNSYNCEKATIGLNNWLSGSGIDLTLDTNWLRQVSFVKTAEQENELRFLTQEDSTPPPSGGEISLAKTVASFVDGGTPPPYDTTWDSKLKAGITNFATLNPLDVDFLLRVGSFQLHSIGHFELSRITDSLNGNAVLITGTVKHSIHDRYDFNAGEQFPPFPIPGFPTIVFDELNLLKKCDKAKDYWQDATWVRTFKVAYNPDDTTNDRAYWNGLLSEFHGP